MLQYLTFQTTPVNIGTALCGQKGAPSTPRPWYPCIGLIPRPLVLMAWVRGMCRSHTQTTCPHGLCTKGMQTCTGLIPRPLVLMAWVRGYANMCRSHTQTTCPHGLGTRLCKHVQVSYPDHLSSWPGYEAMQTCTGLIPRPLVLMACVRGMCRSHTQTTCPHGLGMRLQEIQVPFLSLQVRQVAPEVVLRS